MGNNKRKINITVIALLCFFASAFPGKCQCVLGDNPYVYCNMDTIQIHQRHITIGDYRWPAEISDTEKYKLPIFFRIPVKELYEVEVLDTVILSLLDSVIMLRERGVTDHRPKDIADTVSPGWFFAIELAILYKKPLNFDLSYKIEMLRNYDLSIEHLTDGGHYADSTWEWIPDKVFGFYYKGFLCTLKTFDMWLFSPPYERYIRETGRKIKILGYTPTVRLRTYNTKNVKTLLTYSNSHHARYVYRIPISDPDCPIGK